MILLLSSLLPRDHVLRDLDPLSESYHVTFKLPHVVSRDPEITSRDCIFTTARNLSTCLITLSPECATRASYFVKSLPQLLLTKYSVGREFVCCVQ